MPVKEAMEIQLSNTEIIGVHTMSQYLPWFMSLICFISLQFQFFFPLDVIGVVHHMGQLHEVGA